MTHSAKLGKQAAYIVTCLALVLITTSESFAATAPNLGTAATYGVFSGAGAIGNTGLTIVKGDIGTHVGAFTGFPPGIYTGAKHIADAASLAAKDDVTAAYNSMNDAAHVIMFDTALGATMGNGQILTPRTYGRDNLTTISGNLTFDAKGNPAAVFIIKIRAALNVSKNTKLLLANGAQAANIYWAVAGAVSILDNSIFKGTIVSDGAIHLYGGSTLEGRALAVVGAVTLASNMVSIPGTVAPPENNLVVITPAPGDSVQRGSQNYQITWGGTGIAATKTFEYSLDSGATWTMIGTITADVYSYNWNVPDTVSRKARVRITDANNLRAVSGIFAIVPSRLPGIIVVVLPSAGEVIAGGMQDYQITWTGARLAQLKTFELSLDSGLTWTTIGTMSTDGFTYSWNVPDTASTKAIVRITDQNGITGNSGLFTIASITVVRPALGEVITGGTQDYAITWTGIGLTPQKTFELSLDSGLTWTTIGTISTDSLTYAWDVPDTSSTRAIIRITDQNGITGNSGLFTITSAPTPASIVVLRPIEGEVINGGYQNFPITFTATNTTLQKTFEYSLDGGATWILIEVVNSDAQFYLWASVPNVATTQALIRITDANGVTGTSDLFTITVIPSDGSIDGLTLTGLDGNGNIGNNRTLGISWTFTPDIGTSVDVEYSLDNTITWVIIATVLVSDSPNTSWITPMTGFYNPVFVRVTSTKGMTRASAPFSIGTLTSVSFDAFTSGYSVSNYPNPADNQTTINFVLPIPSDVTLTIIDGRGIGVSTVVAQHFDAGTYHIPYNTSTLPAGIYTYMLQTGATRLVGRMSLIK